MRILCLFVGIAIMVNPIRGRAEDRKFPYEAVIDTDQGEDVLSGPGPKYYATQHLKNGDRVMVHRHDPGGWCMIAPPRGSFSWIRASHVEKDGVDRGWVKSNRVVVHTGSTFNAEDYTTIQADLSKGDAVEILGEKEFSFDDGPRLMLKISPVKGEWRWISRKSIVAADAFRATPFQEGPSSPKKRGGPIADGESFAQPVSTGSVHQDERRDFSTDEASEVRSRQEQELPPGKERLARIDQEFREMIKQDPPKWDLDSLQSQYQQLDEDLGQKTMSAVIGLRRDAVKRYQKIYQDYVDFYRLTSETKQRDAALLSQQHQSESRLTPDQSSPPANTDMRPIPQPQSTSSQATPSPEQSQAGQSRAFDGAGIVQKMAKTFPGGPQYVLISPDGRMLSFLQPAQGVDLNRYTGRAMGIIGQRSHRDDWNADTITVRGLQPVQLRGAR